jgi:DNA-binding MarR family transcriptional regulator
MKTAPSPAELPCVCAAARHAARLLTQLYEKEHGGHLAAPQFALLSVIRHRPGASQAVLARQLDFDKTTLSRNLKLLEKNGWIRHAGSDDLRERGFHLMPAGTKVLAAAAPAWKRAQNRIRSAMTEKQWHAMWQTFGAITAAAREAK